MDGWRTDSVHCADWESHVNKWCCEAGACDERWLEPGTRKQRGVWHPPVGKFYWEWAWEERSRIVTPESRWREVLNKELTSVKECLCAGGSGSFLS